MQHDWRKVKKSGSENVFLFSRKRAMEIISVHTMTYTSVSTPEENPVRTVGYSPNPDCSAIKPQLAFEHPCIPKREAQSYFIGIAKAWH